VIKTQLSSHTRAATYLGTGRNGCLAAILTVQQVRIIDKVSYHQLYRQHITNTCQSLMAADHNAVFTRHCSTKALIKL